MSAAVTAAADTISGALLAGFVFLVVGLAALGFWNPRPPIHSRWSTARALLYALVYGLVAADFSRVIGAALMAGDRTRSLLALADVTFLATGLYLWVMILVEGYDRHSYGFKSAPAARFLLTLLMGLAVALVFSFDSYRSVLRRPASGFDTILFASLASTVGSSVPEQMIFRGYLMTSLDGRTRAWERIVISALAFTAVRALRMAPGFGLGTQGWLLYVLGVVLPLGLWWGLMRELAKGSIWPCLISQCVLEFGLALSGAAPALP